MEALLGYLYLSGQEDRLRELLSRVTPTVEA
jgi:23S rRNA maturation mini-RNase III